MCGAVTAKQGPRFGARFSKFLQKLEERAQSPSVDDGKMVEPRPDLGNRRAIRPGELPPNANPPNNSDKQVHLPFRFGITRLPAGGN
jgi:hypothetical protein